MKEHLRNIQLDDSKMLYKWRNHPEIRRNSYNKKEISLADHEKWLNNLMNDDWSKAYILESNNTPVGVIRFDVEGKKLAKINYLIDPSKHGKGFGSQILKLGVEKVFEDNIELKKVYGFVLKKNIASIKIFEKLSFSKVFENTTEYKFEKSTE